MNYSFSNAFGPGTQNVYGVGIAGFGTAGVENITVTAGDTDDTFNVNQFTSGTALWRLTAAAGRTLLNFGNTTWPRSTNMAAFRFNGQDGCDTFNLNNANARRLDFTYHHAAPATRSSHQGANYSE